MSGGKKLSIRCHGPLVADLRHDRAARLYGREVHAWFTTLAKERSALARYETLLDMEERARADRFRFDEDRERFIIGHGLLRLHLGHYLGIAPTSVRMLRGKHGKPYLQDHDLHFNLSDTKDALVIAVARTEQLGVDVETMDRNVDHLSVGEHYFSSAEVEGMRTAMEPKRRFLELWTRKEAVLKASGVGIMEDLRILNVNEHEQEMTIHHPEFIALAGNAYDVSTWSVGERHIVSIALPAPPDQVHFFATAPAVTPHLPRSGDGN